MADAHHSNYGSSVHISDGVGRSSVSARSGTVASQLLEVSICINAVRFDWDRPYVYRLDRVYLGGSAIEI